MDLNRGLSVNSILLLKFDLQNLQNESISKFLRCAGRKTGDAGFGIFSYSRIVYDHVIHKIESRDHAGEHHQYQMDFGG